MKGFTKCLFNQFDVDNVLLLMPSNCFGNGIIKSNFGEEDILTQVCICCNTDELAFYAARKIFENGYVYKFTCNSYYRRIAEEKRWKLFHYLMNISGAYYDPARLRACIEVLDQRNADPFLDRGVRINYRKYLKFYTHREKARIASIALIGVGKRRRSLDVMRVISRVVWSERCVEKWSE